jgi:hypothetical protein
MTIVQADAPVRFGLGASSRVKARYLLPVNKCLLVSRYLEYLLPVHVHKCLHVSKQASGMNSHFRENQ